MDLYNILLINGLVISIFIYTLGAILLYFPKYNIYGVIIIGIYTILILTAIIYLISLYLNKIIIIIPFIIILCILLIVNLNINSTKCSVFKKNSVYEKPCYETFYTPVGITKLNDGKWCIKNDDGTCRTADGIIKDIDNPDLNNLKKKLITSQKQCNLKLNELKKSISSIEKQKNLSVGPCILANGRWGNIISNYGNKCVPQNLHKKNVDSGKNGSGKKDSGKNGSDKNGSKKLTEKEISNKYNELYKKQGINRKNIQNPNKVLELDSCYPKGTDFNKLCKKTFGKFYKSKTPDVCPCPFKNEKLCEKTAHFNARCYYDQPKDKKYTSCYPITTDFNNICRNTYGDNYGYYNILKGTKGGCGKNDNMAIAECDTNSFGGFNIYNNATDCLKTNNYYDHLQECIKNYPDKNIVAVKDIGGYNCKPGYFKSQCIENIKK